MSLQARPSLNRVQGNVGPRTISMSLVALAPVARSRFEGSLAVVQDDNEHRETHRERHPASDQARLP